MSRRLLRLVSLTALLVLGTVPTAAAQQPTPEQARELLRTRPDLAAQVRQRIGASGLTPDQVRARLRAAGYPETLLDDYLVGADTTRGVSPGGNVIEAVRLLGIASAEDLDSLTALTDSARLAMTRDPAAAERRAGLQTFGLEVFRQTTSQFEPALAGPVDAGYRLGPGDILVLLLSGDVELAHTLEVNREGFVVIPQVGQLYVASLTLQELESLLYTRLGRVYSGIRRGPGATTQFRVTVARLRRNQVFVVGDVARPGSYQVSAAGTVLTALYAAGGPTGDGSFRRVEVRRGQRLVDSLDIYDYLLRGNARSDIRLETGDVVFVPVRGPAVKVTGRVVRPAGYELRPGETLRDLIRFAGGFDAAAVRRRIQVHRILPPEARTPGRDRVVLDIGADQVPDSLAPPIPLAMGDSVVVFEVSDRPRGFVTVTGNVWLEGKVGFAPGMRLSDAIRQAGGPKPDVYLSRILVTRLQNDSTRIQLRSAFADSTGAVEDDFQLSDEDEIQVFSRTDFRPERYVAVTGAVRRPGRIPFRDGMTMRDAILQARGITEDAWLKEAEIARLPADRSRGVVATTLRVPLDSTYLFEKDRDSTYLGPPGLPAPAAGAPETVLEPYDNILVLRQPEWELQRTVAITGQVRYPGRYALKTRTDRLADLVARAGGLTGEAYPLGVEFYRSLNRAGRIGVDLPRALRDPRARDNLILVGGDSIFIPEYNPVVRVGGAVNAPVAVAYSPGKNLEHYVSSAGGYSRTADRSRAYVTQPNGIVESVHRRFLFPDSKPRPLAGASIFVPEKDPADRKDYVAIFGSVAQILASIVAIVVVSTR